MDSRCRKCAWRIFQSCDKLKHVTINRYTDSIMKIKSQLETFELIKWYKQSLSSPFLQFLKSQKSSLKNLTLVVQELDDEIADFIYFEMKLDKLVDYRIDYSEIHKLNKTKKNLAVRTKKSKFDYFEKIFQCCEMLEVLSVDMPGKNRLELLHLISHLPKLKNLKLSRGNTEEELEQPTFKFDQLERIILSNKFTVDQCVKIIRCCPNLTHVKINVILTKDDFENILQDCNKIQEIVLISSEEVLSDENLEVYKNFGSTIKLKIETGDKQVVKKLSDAKNRVTVILKETPRRDPFKVCPDILSHLYYDYGALL